MAGFEFEVKTSEKSRYIARMLLSFVQRLGKERQCEVRYKWEVSNHYLVTVDGALPCLQTLCLAVCKELFPYAQGLVSAHNRRTALDIAYRIVGAYQVGLKEISDTVQTAANTFGGIPNSFFFDSGRVTHARRKLYDLTRSLLLYSEGQLVADQLAEQIHTVAELLLKKAVPSCKTGAFSELVMTAAAEVHLPKKMEDNLLRLKDMRRDSKHRGRCISDEELSSILASLIGAIHFVLKRLR
jgi:hypothetical protein